MNRKDQVFADISAAIIAQLEQGVRPWAKPWDDAKAGAGTDMPRNVKGRFYRGANVFWLMLAQQARGYSSPVWLTFNQALDLGGNVRKGEKATPVFFWSFQGKEDKETGKTKRMVFCKVYSVFNADQCDGLDLPKPEPLPEPARIAAADSLMEATGARINYGGARAFYSPAFDSVQLPPRAAFVSVDSFYATAFHELGHWTGHSSRLAREFGAKFGDSAYAFEELVAELTAAFVCGSQGFANVVRDDHAPYLANWLKVLKDNPGAFVTAASQAQKAADFILAAAEAEEEPEAAEAIAA